MPATPEKIVDIPEGLEQRVGAAPADLKDAIAHSTQQSPCAMPYTLLWRQGPRRGYPVSGFCTSLTLTPDGRDGCARTGHCVGPTFVPHLEQYTTADTQDPTRQQRGLDPREIIEAVKRFGEKATRITKVKDRRSDREIAYHVVTTWAKLRAAVRGGGWSGS